jgi:hypothetical protein
MRPHRLRRLVWLAALDRLEDDQVILRDQPIRGTLDAGLDLMQIFLLQENVDERLKDATARRLRDQAVDSAVGFDAHAPTANLLRVSLHCVLDLSNLSLGRAQRRETGGFSLDGPPHYEQFADISDGLSANRTEQIVVAGTLPARAL